jgi:hypothetical protein
VGEELIDSRETYENVDNASDSVPENITDSPIKDTDGSPVEGTDNHQDECNNMN